MINKKWNKVICIASGPSLEAIQIHKLITLHPDAKVITVSDNYKLYPYADVVYAADHTWWNQYYDQVCSTVSEHTELWAKSTVVKGLMNSRRRLNKPILKELHAITVNFGNTLDSDSINHGGNSGFMAVNLAYLFGAKEIYLLGYDFQHTNGKSHWFGDHPPAFLLNAANADKWIRPFLVLCLNLQNEGTQVFNATKETAITNCDHCRRIEI